MAGAGFKTFNTGDVLTASDVNTYLMQQTVMVFASAAARTTALGANVAEGMLSYLKDTDVVEVYNGSAWVSSDDPNAIQNTIVDAKGDLISATAADTPARLAVGANGYTLVADSSQTTGLKWQGFSGCAVNATSSLLVSNGTYTTVNFDAEQWDTDNYHSTTTNTSRLVVPTAGYYRIDIMSIWQSSSGTTKIFRLLKNGSTLTTQAYPINTTIDANYGTFYVVYLAANDYIELQVYQDSGASKTFYIRSSDGFMSIQRLGV